MANLDVLIPHIYHEKQQEGSMLCAQHALNSLLRASTFYYATPYHFAVALTLSPALVAFDLHIVSRG